LANYSLSGIKLNVILGNTEHAKEELTKLIKKLENNTIKINVDFKDVKEQLYTITKTYEQATKTQENAVSKSQATIKKIYKTSNAEIKAMVEEQRKLLESQYGNKGKINYTYATDQFGNSNITGAFIEIKNQAQETEKVMFGLRESVKTVGNEIQKIYTFDATGKKEILNLSQADKDLNKFNNTVSNTRKKYENEINKLINKNKELASDKGIIEFKSRLENLDNFEFDDLQQELKELQLQFNKLKIGFQETGALSQTSDNLFKRVGQYFTASSIYYEFSKAVKFGVSSIIELDDAMTDLKKVTNESDSTYKEFMNTANKMAIDLGNSTKGIIDATAMYAQMGYTMEEAIEASKTNTIYSNVADVDSITAAEHLISIMQAFNVQSKDSIQILDRLNEVSNSYSISASGLGEALKRGSSALVAANNNLSESVAMVTAANTVIQNPEEVGNALKSISMALQGVNESTGELIPKFRELVLENTNFKVDIWDEQNQAFKSTYDIMVEMSSVWDELSDKQQAFLATKIIGKHRSNVFYSLMQSGELLVDVYNTAEASAGSAYREQSKYMESLSAKINELKENSVLLWQTIINEDDFGNMIEFLSKTVSGINAVIDSCGGVAPVLSLILSGLVAIKALKIADGIISIGTNVSNLGKSMVSLVTGLKSTVAGMTAMKTAITGLTGVVGILGVTISGLVMLQNKHKQEQEDIARANRELADSYTEETNGIKEVIGQYSKIYSSTDDTVNKKQELSILQDKLISDYGLEKDAIDLVNGSYEEQISLLNGIVNSKANASNVLLKDSSMDLLDKMGEITNNLGGKDLFGFDKAFSFDSSKHKEDFEKIAKTINDEIGYELIKTRKNGVSDSYFVGLFGDPKDELKAFQMLISEIDKSSLSHSAFADIIKTSYRDMIPLAEEYSGTLEKMTNNTINNLANQQGINDITNATKEEILSLEKAYVSSQNSIKTSTQAQQEFRQAMSGVNKEFDEYVNGTKQVEDSTQGANTQQGEFSNSLEDLMDQFNNASDKIATLNTISKELKESNGLSADSFKKIASEFPELLGYMNDEASLADAIKDKMESLSAVQGDAYRQMLFNSEEYYEQNVLGNEQMINSISSGIENLFRNLSTAYQGDLSNWKSLAQGKADIETQLIASLNKEWEKHFGTLMTQFNKMANTPIANPQFDEAKYKDQLYKENPFLTSTQTDILLKAARDTFNKQTSEYKQFQVEMVKRNQELSNMFSDVKFDAIDIKVGGGGKIGSGSKSKGASSSKDSFEKYYSQLIDETIDTILSENERLEDAIAFAQEKLANAELKGDTKQQEILNKQILEFTKQKKELSHKMAEELRKVGNDVRIQLGNMNIKGYENFNFANLTELDVAKIKQSYDKLAVGASDSVKANIEKEKSMFEELANVVLRIYGEEIPNLQKQWWAEDTNYRQQQIDKIHEIADLEKRAYDDKVKRIQLEQMLMDDSGKEYQAKEEEKYQLLLGLKLRYEDKIRQLKAQGLNDESEDVRKYVDLWVDAEEELLNMRKSMAERQREIGLKGYEERLKVLNDQKAAIKTISDLTIQMIKKEIEIKKKAFQEEIDGYQAVINKKKESLRKEKEDKDYKKELSEIEKQEEILNNKIAELSLDNSGDMNEKRLELEEELRELLEKKEELQNDKSLQNKEDLLDQELEAFEKEKQEEIDKLDEYLDKEGQLRQDALDMIKRNNKEMYEKLLEYNATYGDAMQEDIVKAWGLATDAANEFNNGQMDLLDILKDVTDEMAEQVRLQDELKNAHWTDIPLGNNTENSPSGSGSTGGSSWHDKKDKIAKQMQSNSKEWFNASDEQKKKLAQENEKLGQQIGAWKGSDGEWWIMVNGKRMKLYDSIGVRHTGIETGFVGGKALSKGSQEFMKLMRGEEFNILKAGEIVANPRQMDNVMNKVIPGMLARNSKTSELKIEGDLCRIVINGNADKDTIKLLRKETDRIANYTLDKLKGVMNLGY
jgi:TP901 family phage tail tape measure protein